MYVTNTYNNKIKKRTSAGVWSDITGSQTFGCPYGVAVDSTGNVYVTDTYNSKIKKRTTAGVWSDITGSESFNSPGGVAVDSIGNVYVADTYNSKIKKFSPDSTISPSAGSFDKKTSAQADVSTTMTLNGNSLSSITNGVTPLVLATDYTVAGNTVTIKKEYLAAHAVGTTSLVLSFSAGSTQTLAITVSDTTSVVLSSIAITTPATKLSYTVGDTLNLSGTSSNRNLQR